MKFAATPTGQIFIDERALSLEDGKLKYFEIRAVTMGQQWEIDSGEDIYASTYNFTQNYIKNAPGDLKSVKYASMSFAQRAT